MIGLLLIYFIGKYFYDIALEFNRKPWPYAILGVAAYYGFQILVGIIMYILADLLGYPEAFGIGEFALNFLGVAVGALFTWGLYKLVLHNFKTKTILNDEDILDGEFID